MRHGRPLRGQSQSIQPRYQQSMPWGPAPANTCSPPSGGSPHLNDGAGDLYNRCHPTLHHAPFWSIVNIAGGCEQQRSPLSGAESTTGPCCLDLFQSSGQHTGHITAASLGFLSLPPGSACITQQHENTAHTWPYRNQLQFDCMGILGCGTLAGESLLWPGCCRQDFLFRPHSHGRQAQAAD